VSGYHNSRITIPATCGVKFKIPKGRIMISKRRVLKKLLLAVLIFGLGAASSAFAGTDMLIGSFAGKWCNYDARFDIETKETGRWIFRGRILIHETGQYDPVWIEQYDDDSLRIIRYLQGANLGQTQVVQTHPPQTNLNNNVFYSQQGYGYGCEGTSSFLITPP
jgi:hypothetical protein